MLLLVAGAVLTGYGQVPMADFSFPATACREEFLDITNHSTNATSWEWDFCLHDAENLISDEALASIQGLSGAYGYKLVEENGEWTGFVTSLNNHFVYRLDFGNSPSNTPSITNLGNPGGLLVYPEGIEIVSDDGNWYGFVGSFNVNHGVVKLDFGASLKNNSPVAINIGNFGFSTRVRALKVVEQNSEFILVMAGYNLNSIIRINYRDSFNNTISAANISDSGTLTGLGNPMGMDVTIAPDGDIIMLVASYNGNAINRLNFGSDILSQPSVEATYSFPEIAKPYYVRMIREGNQYYAAVSNETLGIAILNLFELNSSETPEVVPYVSLPVGGGIATFRKEGKSFIHLAGTVNSQLRQLTFESVCDASISFFSGEDPSMPAYATAGPKVVELRVFNAADDISIAAREVTISSDIAPDILFTSTNMCANHNVDFKSQNLSGDIKTYQWAFGDAGESTSADPSHQYDLPGEYRIELRVTSDNGCANIAADSLKIYEQPVAGFSVPGMLICTNNEYTFSNITADTYEGNLAYQWFVDGAQTGIERNLVTAFLTAEPKEIRLVTSIPGCSDEATETILSVVAGPVVDFSWSGTCESDTFSFQSEISDPVENYFWNFDNGDTSTDPNPSQVFTEFGNFSVSLTVTSAIGCENTKTQTVSVRSEPVVDFVADGPPNACAGTPTLFENQTTNPDGGEITTWLWNFGEQADAASQGELHGQHIYAAAGAYEVSLTSTTAEGCVGVGQTLVTINPSPSTEFTFGAACDDVPVLFAGPQDPDIADWYWEIGTSYYDDPSPTHTFRSPGDFPLYLEVTGSNGCVATLSRNIRVPITLNPAFSYTKNCVGQEAVFTDITSGQDPVVSRSWNFGDGSSYSGSSVTYTFAQAGNREVALTVTAESGCSYETLQQVSILPSPVAGFTANPSSGAFPLEVAFSNTSQTASGYLWEFLDGTGSTSTEMSPVYTFSGPGTFDVKLTATSGEQCESSFVASITTVAPLPDADIDAVILTPNPDGSLKVIVTIHNKGNTIVHDLPVTIDFSGKLSLTQTVGEPIQPGTKYNLVLTGILNPESIRYLCATVSLPNDLTPAGNRMCAEHEGEMVFISAYPNPTNGTLNIEWLSETAQTVSISLCDAIGRQVREHQISGVAGLNRQRMDVSGLENGIYLLRIQTDANPKTQRILVSGNP